MATLPLSACTCEHRAHFPADATLSHPRTPHGNPGHVYGTRYVQRYIRPVQTPYGTFHVCLDCAADCLASR